MVFHWSLSDSKSPQVSRAVLSIQANLNNAVVWMVSTHALISNPLSPITNPLVTVLSAPITIGITVTFIFHSFFSSQARSRYITLFSLSCTFTLWSARKAKSTIWILLLSSLLFLLLSFILSILFCHTFYIRYYNNVLCQRGQKYTKISFVEG